MSAWVKTKELSGDDKLEYLREKYKDRNLLEELGWGAYNIRSGYLNKSDADFLNWLCNAAYREIKKLTNRDPADCTGCIYQEGMGGPCDSCCRRYRDYYEEC